MQLVIFIKLFVKIKGWFPKLKKKNSLGVPVVPQQVKILTSIHEGVGSIPGLAQWVKDPALPQAAV